MVKKLDEKANEKGTGMTSPYLSRPIRDLDEVEAEIRRFRTVFQGDDAELASVRTFSRVSRIIAEIPDGD